jgi:cyclopropane-fatty-acyl-phospholipid synthase
MTQVVDGPTPVRTTDTTVADELVPAIEALTGHLPVRLELWDGSTRDASDAVATIRLRSPDAVRRVLWAPGELGVARAYVAGDLEVEGDMLETIRALRPAGRRLRRSFSAVPRVLRAARDLGLGGSPPPPPPEEARPHGRLHSRARDAEAIGHHYDVGNDFYQLVLGPSLTYSCARFTTPDTTLEDAQASKYELVCRKLGLHERPGQRLLDVGCGWGSMAIHAARHHGASVVGVTISREQADLARRRVTEAGLGGRVEIRLQDYRDVRGERFDAISSIGMSEHVGRAGIGEYFDRLASLVARPGRVLNHAISSVRGSRLGRRTFMYRYVFPDAELLDVSETVRAMEAAGLEVRDVESLREHYARTLRHWVANLERHWDEAVALVGEGRARVWRLYMAGAAVGFDDGGLGVHQVLAAAPSRDGTSAMPATRDSWVTAGSS